MPRIADKRARELGFLEDFRTLWSSCPQSIVCLQEQPDFIFAPHRSQVGIEVTELIRRTTGERRPLQEQEALKERLSAEASRVHRERGLPALHVSVHIHPRQPLNKCDVRPLAKKLVDFVASIDIAPDSVVRHPTPADFQSRLPKPVLSLTVANVASLTRAHWTVPTAAWIPTLDAEQVQATIDRQSKSSRKHLSAGYSCWLLMVIGGPGLASSYTVPEPVLSHTYKSSFEQVFLMDNLRRTVWSLAADCG